MQNSLYSVKNLEFAYGSNKVLSDVSFDIKAGSIVSFMGANGCGKTTLFHLMTKSLVPAQGTVCLDGTNICDIKLNAFSRQVAIVHQLNTAPPDITVRSLVAYGRTPYRGYFSPVTLQDEDAVDRALEITDLVRLENTQVGQLSGGQKQRVFIAMAIAQETKVLFLDEPTTYLDIRYQVQILNLIQRLNQEFNITIIMVLHDINQALHYANHIIALTRTGQLLTQGEPAQVVTQDVIEQVYGIRLKMAQVDGKQVVLC
jgi:iron complex transport system ATP-binding protein